MSNGNNEFSWWSDALSGVKTPSVGLKPQQEEEQDKNVEETFLKGRGGRCEEWIE